jgi:hypothetical protein
VNGGASAAVMRGIMPLVNRGDSVPSTRIPRWAFERWGGDIISTDSVIQVPLARDMNVYGY